MDILRNRIRIAQLSAQIIVEEGVNDYASAKRKAAERLGLDWGKNLPDDHCVTEALQQYHRIFRATRQPTHIRNLRQTALDTMEFFNRFKPRLVGPVLEGTAGEHQSILVLLFPENNEDVITLLTQAKIPFKETSSGAITLHGRKVEISSLSFCWHGQPVEARLYPYSSRGMNSKNGPRSASIKALRHLLSDNAGKRSI